MTATAEKAGRPQAPGAADRYTAIAAKLLAGHDFKPDRRPAVARALGLALAATSPQSEHGQVLASTLRPARWADRPAAERAVLQLARHGETPTEAAVTVWLEGARRRRERGQQIDATITAYVEADGARAADYVAGVVRDTGQGPTWTELARAMGWPGKPWGLRSAIIRRLARAGWIEFTTETRSLRLGPGSVPPRGSVR
jgi:hypothetical protein